MRYAIYYTPAPGSPLAAFGDAWLTLGGDQRDAQSHGRFGLPAALHAKAIATPIKYGLHATLKAPFRLATNANETSVMTACAQLAARLHAFEIGPLHLTRLGACWGLTPPAPDPRLSRLEAACVEELEPLRAPLSVADIARRNPAALSERQRALLNDVGYPYALDEFRFHMTLSSRLDDGEAREVEQALRRALSGIVAPNVTDSVGAGNPHAGSDGPQATMRDALPLVIDAISLVADHEDGKPFQLVERFALGHSH
ncbi:MAG: DUF1045 domain-containing protein [Pseudomonadota bacterium]